jgi:hypothetical protein
MGFPVFFVSLPYGNVSWGVVFPFFPGEIRFQKSPNAREPFRNAPDRPSTSRRVEARCNDAHICIIYDNICKYVYMIFI